MLYEFALKNIAREYFFEPSELPLTIRALDSFYLLLLPSPRIRVTRYLANAARR